MYDMILTIKGDYIFPTRRYKDKCFWEKNRQKLICNLANQLFYLLKTRNEDKGFQRVTSDSHKCKQRKLMLENGKDIEIQ